MREDSEHGEYYLASEADAEHEAEIADMRAGFALELASKNARIAELEVARDALMISANKQGDRIQKLKQALRYWIPDETLVEQRHEAAWNEHVKLLGSSL